MCSVDWADTAVHDLLRDNWYYNPEHGNKAAGAERPAEEEPISTGTKKLHVIMQRARHAARSTTIEHVVIVAVVLLSRLPFLGGGYGSDPDAWRVASAARTIATTGTYVASRLPGYPIPELVYSILWPASPLLFNFLTMLFSAGATAFFVLSLRHLGCRDARLASLGFALTPVVYINSTNSMDYVWAVAFLMGSLYFALVRRPIWAGMLLGAAIGCRITSALMLLPFGLLLVQNDRPNKPLRRLVGFSVITFLIGVVTFAPVFTRYGTGLFTFSQASYPDWSRLISLGLVGVWGRIGMAALVVTVLYGMIYRGAGSLERTIPFLQRPYHLAFISVIAVYGLAFLGLPLEPGYLIPIVPFTIILLGVYLERRTFQLLCVALLGSSFVDFDQSGIAPGPIFQERISRVAGAKEAGQTLALGNRLPPKSVVVVGPLLPQIELSQSNAAPRDTDYVYLLDETQAAIYRANGYRIYYRTGMRELNQSIYGVDLDLYGGMVLRAADGRQQRIDDIDAR